MKRIILACFLWATPALAAEPPPPPGLRAWEIIAHQCTLREQNATSIAVELQDKVAELTKELEDLKAAQKPTETK